MCIIFAAAGPIPRIPFSFELNRLDKFNAQDINRPAKCEREERERGERQTDRDRESTEILQKGISYTH